MRVGGVCVTGVSGVCDPRVGVASAPVEGLFAAVGVVLVLEGT